MPCTPAEHAAFLARRRRADRVLYLAAAILGAAVALYALAPPARPVMAVAFYLCIAAAAGFITAGVVYRYRAHRAHNALHR